MNVKIPESGHESDFQRWSDAFGVVFPVEIDGSLQKVKAHDSVFESAPKQPEQGQERDAVLAFKSTLEAMIRECSGTAMWPAKVIIGEAK